MHFIPHRSSHAAFPFNSPETMPYFQTLNILRSKPLVKKCELYICLSISQTFHGKCTTGYLNHEIIKLIKSLNIQQALRKFSATIKGLYRQTYQIFDC